MGKRLVLLGIVVCVSLLGVAGEKDEAKKDSIAKAEFQLQPDAEFTAHLDVLLTQLMTGFEVTYSDSTELNIYNYPKDSIPIVNDSTLKSRLEILNEKTPFALGYNKRVHAFVNLYAVKRRELSSKTMGLGQLYFPLIEEELDKNDMPLELKYLAVVESALNPTARSRAGAKGLWQFMYTTGKIYDLKVNSYYDERNDPYKSTKAACGYLSYLHNIYDDWNLALAAYNCGPGNVNKAIRRSGGKKDYWEIYPYLPRETRGYVPAFIAVNYVFNYGAEHNIYPRTPPTTFHETDTIQVTNRIAFTHLAEVLKISFDDIQYLNPEYKKGIIPKDGKSHTLRLPKGELALYLVNEKSITDQYSKPIDHSDEVLAAQEQVEVYRVRSGDYLGKIATRYGVSVRQVKSWNGLRSDNLRVGQRLTIHTKGSAPVVVKKQKVDIKKNTIESENFVYYKIQKGDTLWDIAKSKGMSTNQLKLLNKNLNAKNLKPGDKIIISKKS